MIGVRIPPRNPVQDETSSSVKWKPRRITSARSRATSGNLIVPESGPQALSTDSANLWKLAGGGFPVARWRIAPVNTAAAKLIANLRKPRPKSYHND
jgi:hypothetical protein